MNPILSIIVPIYNVENYLSSCLDSILNQTFSNFEIILINDGSTDKSGNICNYYAKSDGRIKVIHKENGGVSSARNKGIDVANGKYIGFVDPDDTIESDMFKQLIETISNHNADIAICPYTTIDLINNTTIVSEIFDKVNCRIDKVDINKEIIPKVLHTIYGVYSIIPCWNKVYKRSVFENIRFDETMNYGEDRRLNYTLVTLVSSIVYVNKPLYNYYKHQRDSLTQNFKEDYHFILENKRFKTSICIKNKLTKFIDKITNDYISQSLVYMQRVSNSELPLFKKMNILKNIMNDQDFKKDIKKFNCPSLYYRILKLICVLKNVSLFIVLSKTKITLKYRLNYSTKQQSMN